jgi:hypothetical protein
MSLFRVIKQLADSVDSAPPPGGPTEAETPWDARYHRKIVFVAGFLAFLGSLLGVIISGMMANDAKSGKDVKGIILVPLLFGAAGFMSGMAMMCLVAPRTFLTGPIGRQWMKLIGTESVVVARITCLLFGSVVTAPLVGLGVLFALSK